MIPVRRLAHLGIAVPDLELAADFYVRVLGMQVSDRLSYPPSSPFEQAIWLRCNTDHHCMSLFKLRDSADCEDGPRIGLHHIAFELATFDELLAAYRTVKREGIPLVDARWGGPGNQPRVYVRDPAGNIVELYWDLDQIGWDGASRPFPPIVSIDLEEFDVEGHRAYKARTRLAVEHTIDGNGVARVELPGGALE